MDTQGFSKGIIIMVSVSGKELVFGGPEPLGETATEMDASRLLTTRGCICNLLHYG